VVVKAVAEEKVDVHREMVTAHLAMATDLPVTVIAHRVMATQMAVALVQNDRLLKNKPES